MAYVLQPGDLGYDPSKQHGLIASPRGTSRSTPRFKENYSITNAKGLAIGSGQANTLAIVNAQGIGTYEAKVCYDLVIDGYKDWFLPSKDELNQLYLNKDVIGGFDEITDISVYCSSTEHNGNTVSSQNFSSSNGEQRNTFNKNSYGVRAARYF